MTAVVFISAADLHAACTVRNSNGQVTSSKFDPLFLVLEKSVDCPEDIQSLKALLKQEGLASQPYMVANRGIHNPAFGSFSFFEKITGVSPLFSQPIENGEVFLGHFTGIENNTVVADQEPTKGKLLIELIAWDKVKKLFNFYELIGTGMGAKWFYRGDSQDILTDNAFLYLNPQGPKFGSTLRCSACHTSGGPIMKEMALPHNDWWTASRPLYFAQTISHEVSTWVKQLGYASEFSQSVQAGIKMLEQSPKYQNAKQRFSLQVILRPLFCETEINLESDPVPLDQAFDSVQIPSTSIVSPFLASGPLSISSSAYHQLLKLANMQFPETSRRDADHGWLVPVKGYSDSAEIKRLVENRTVTEEFVADVLAVDLENPFLSSKRCGLLQLIPSEGLSAFPERLKSSTLPGVGELYENLTNPLFTRNFHLKRAQELLAQTQRDLNTLDGQKRLFKKLIDARQAVFDAEISKNPRGQILEPGFRVIFPVPH